MIQAATLDDWTAMRMHLASPLTAAARDAWQLTQIRETLALARTSSPFYRARRDWPEGTIACLADLTRFPFTTPDDLLRNQPSLLATSQGAVDRVVSLPTSGSSGKTKRMFFAADEVAATIDYFHHGMAQFTSAGDRVAIAFPATTPGSVGDDLVQAMSHLGATPLVVPPAAKGATLATWLREMRADVVAGAPSQLLAAARANVPQPKLRAVLASAERLPPPVARRLRCIWGCEVFDHWGMTEIGYGGAVECAMHDGCHMRESDLYCEIVDPQTGAPLEAGMCGELVITTLQPRAVPLVRYRTGDLACLLEQPCRCGSVLRRLTGFAGRIEAGIPLGDGTSLSFAELEDTLFAIEPLINFAAQVIEQRVPRLLLEVAGETAAVGSRVESALRHHLRAGPALALGRLHLVVTEVAPDDLRHLGKRQLQRRVA